MGDPTATEGEMRGVAKEFGYEIDAICDCPIQGVLIEYSRPVREGETLLGLPVAGPRVRREVIERHYCMGDPDDKRMEITLARACQRAIWEMLTDATSVSVVLP